MSRKGFKIRKVVKEFTAPSAYSVSRGYKTMFTFELLECGHVHEKPEIRESAKMVRAMFREITGEPTRRRCFECVTGKPVIPQPAEGYIPNQD